MPSSITYLSSLVPTKRQASAAVAVAIRQHSHQIKRARWLNSAHTERSARAAIARTAAVAAQPAIAVFNRLSRMFRLHVKLLRTSAGGYFTAMLRRLFGGLNNVTVALRAANGAGGALRGVLKRLRGLTAPDPTPVLFLNQQREKSQRLVWLVVRSAVTFTILLAKVRRQRSRRDRVLRLAAEFVSRLINHSQDVVLLRVLSLRDRGERKTHAATIQRVCRAWKSRQEDERRRRLGLLSLLSTAHAQYHSTEAHNEAAALMAARVGRITFADIAHELSRRRAAEHIQRVWRGSRARSRVCGLLSAKKRKKYLKVQRERVRRARAALLGASAKEASCGQAVAKRVAAWQEKTPQQNAHAMHGALTHARQSALQPLPRQIPPPFSRVTGARILPVTVPMFEKIRARHTRVNLLNVWVAVPVAYTNTATSNRDRNRLMVTLDWVPATVLSRP